MDKATYHAISSGTVCCRFNSHEPATVFLKDLLAGLTSVLSMSHKCLRSREKIPRLFWKVVTIC